MPVEDHPIPVHIRSELSESLPGEIAMSSPGEEMERIFIERTFPFLRMERWIGCLLSLLGPGEVTSFSAIALALGEVRAARAVGMVLSRSGIPRSHRVVYSDGRVPSDSIGLLSSELDISGGSVPAASIVRFEAEDPPFRILKGIQTAMETLPVPGISTGPDLAGTDISSDLSCDAAALCLTDPCGIPEGNATLSGDLCFPYVPGYLFYREAPLLVTLIRKARDEGLMDRDPLVLIDGNGRLHPRRMGIALQLGMVTGEPTCGVAKHLLLGSVGEWFDGSAPVIAEGQVLGMAVRNGAGRPIYISEGTGPSLEECVRRVRLCMKGSHPEPLKAAHRLANSVRRSQKP
jgi:deoxyribonuclease V